MHPLLENFGLYAIDHGMVRTIAFDVRGHGPRSTLERRVRHVIGVYYFPGEEIHVVALGTVSTSSDGYEATPVSPGTFDEEPGRSTMLESFDDAVVWLRENFRDQVEALTLQAGTIGEA